MCQDEHWSKSQTERPKTQRKCQYCSKVHDMKRCLAFGRICIVCGQRGLLWKGVQKTKHECATRQKTKRAMGGSPQNTIGQ